MLKVFIGWDPRDDLAFRACVSSLRAHASIPLEIYPLREHELRRRGIYRRPYAVLQSGQMVDGIDGGYFSTQFSFTRYAVPLISDGHAPVLFCDPDMLWRRDVAELVNLIPVDKAICCVQHDYRPSESSKMDGVQQKLYPRKNWSSLMLLRPARCRMTQDMLNTFSKTMLHGLHWQSQHEIGGLPEEWNWLEGWSSQNIEPAVVHFTRGTPDMRGDDMPFASQWWQAVHDWKPTMNEMSLENCFSHRPAAAS